MPSVRTKVAWADLDEGEREHGEDEQWLYIMGDDVIDAIKLLMGKGKGKRYEIEQDAPYHGDRKLPRLK